jgi:hypothetical protein
MTEYLVNLDADPFVPKGWKVAVDNDGKLRHIRSGKFKFDHKKIGLHLSQKHVGSIGVVPGYEFLKELGDQPVCNANLLDFCLERPHLIPENLRGKVVFFLGTVYCDSYGNEICRCLGGGSHCWYWSFGWLKHGWEGKHPVAVLSV